MDGGHFVDLDENVKNGNSSENDVVGNNGVSVEGTDGMDEGMEKEEKEKGVDGEKEKGVDGEKERGVDEGMEKKVESEGVHQEEKEQSQTIQKEETAMKQMDEAADKKKISQLEAQITGFVQSLTEMDRRCKKSQKDAVKWKKIATEQAENLKKFKIVFQRSKEKMALMSAQEEIDQWRNRLQMMKLEHDEQATALRNNVQHMYKELQNTQNELEKVKDEKLSLEAKLSSVQKIHADNSSSTLRQDQLDDLIEKCKENLKIDDESFVSVMKDGHNELSVDIGDSCSSINLFLSTKIDELFSNVKPSKEVTIDTNLLGKVDELEKELSENKQRFAEEVKTHDQKLDMWIERHKMKVERIKELDKQIAQIEDQSKGKDILVHSYKKTIEKMEKIIANKDQELSELDHSNKEAISNLKTADQMINAYKRRVTTLTETQEKLRQEIAKLNLQIKEDGPIVEKGKQYDELFKEKNTLKEDNSRLSGELLRKRKEYESTRKELNACKSTISELKQKEIYLNEQITRHHLEMDEERKKQEILMVRFDEFKHRMMDRERLHQDTIKEFNKELSIKSQDETYTIKFFVEKALNNFSRKVMEEKFFAYQRELESTGNILSDRTHELKELRKKCEDLETEIQDVKLKHKIDVRKQHGLIKELKKQIKDDKKNQRRWENSSVTSRTSVNSMNRRASFASNVSLASNQADIDVLSHENDVLLKRVGTYQATQWRLEEKVKFLEGKLLEIQDDNDKKHLIIERYIAESKPATSQNPSAQKGGWFSSWQKPNYEEIHKKSMSIMQETLAKNITLTDIVAKMGEKVDKLMQENAALKEKIESVQ